MGIGLGIVLIVIGAILLFALNINIPFVSDDTLGIILIVAGAITLILALVMNAQRAGPSTSKRIATTVRRQQSDQVTRDTRVRIAHPNRLLRRHLERNYTPSAPSERTCTPVPDALRPLQPAQRDRTERAR
jgi:hypothetical protein